MGDEIFTKEGKFKDIKKSLDDKTIFNNFDYLKTRGMDTKEIVEISCKIISAYDDLKQEEYLNQLAEVSKFKINTLKKVIKKYCDNNKNEEIEQTGSFFLEENHFIAEQVYTELKENKFAVYYFNTKEIEYVDEIKIKGLTYKPINSVEVKNGFLKLPSKAKEYNNDQELDEEIINFVNKWLDIEKQYLRFAVYNIRKSWVYDRFHSLNYLRAIGDFGSGKSRFLDTLGYIHYKPIATSGALTPAVLFRISNKWQGTLIIDEADFKNSDESQDIIKIINQGYEKGRPVMRIDKENNMSIEFFDVYGPKILATRKEFSDKATESRCMSHVMKTTTRKDIPPNLTAEFEKECDNIRNKLLMWRFKNYLKIDPDAGLKVDLGNIEPRLRQVNSGFISLFADNPEEIKKFKEYLFEYQKDLIEERSNTIEGNIVKAINELYILGDPINANNIIEKANLKDKQGNLWKPRSLTKFMKGLGFSSTKQKKIDNQNYKIYDETKEFYTTLFKKYIPFFEEVTVQDQKNTTVTTVTFFDENDVKRYLSNQGNRSNGTVGVQKKQENNMDKSIQINTNIDNFDKKTQIKSIPLTKVTSVTRLPNKENMLIKYLEKYDKGDGVKIDFLNKVLNFDDEDDCHAFLCKLSEKGIIFQNRSDFWKLLK
jgi:hypothetical protein